MAKFSSADMPVKPRVLIADDSRIVRASLIKHIEGMFEFREALDGEQAWETLLLDPSIRVVITDLTMPKLDGYGLLQRIRNSKVARIRTVPVIVVSGSDERAERERAKAAGATDLITKGIGTAQLLSRLDILAKLANTQHEFERSLEVLVDHAGGSLPDLPAPEEMRLQAAALLARAIKSKKNFVALNVCVGLRRTGEEASATCPPIGVVDAIGRLLQRTVRQTDRVSKTGEAEFTLATGSINVDAARLFAERVCGAIANANLTKDEQASLIASCGLATLNDDVSTSEITFDMLHETARRRAALGLGHGAICVVGPEEEVAFLQGKGSVSELDSLHREKNTALDPIAHGKPDLAMLLQWMKEGRQELVLPHIEKLSVELQPLVELMLKKNG